jgi:hypothetical protein
MTAAKAAENPGHPETHRLKAASPLMGFGPAGLNPSYGERPRSPTMRLMIAACAADMPCGT